MVKEGPSHKSHENEFPIDPYPWSVALFKARGRPVWGPEHTKELWEPCDTEEVWRGGHRSTDTMEKTCKECGKLRRWRLGAGDSTSCWPNTGPGVPQRSKRRREWGTNSKQSMRCCISRNQKRAYSPSTWILGWRWRQKPRAGLPSTRQKRPLARDRGSFKVPRCAWTSSRNKTRGRPWGAPHGGVVQRYSRPNWRQTAWHAPLGHTRPWIPARVSISQHPRGGFFGQRPVHRRTVGHTCRQIELKWGIYIMRAPLKKKLT